MRAIVLEHFGGLDGLVYTDIPKPLPKAGEVVIEVKAFGLNHAEMHMRKGEWAAAAEVSGIECVGTANVALIDSDRPWSRLAALPETYSSAWTCLFRNLDLQPGRTIVIRGSTSSFGQAAVKMAVGAGAKVIATARNRDRFGMLEELGVSRSVAENPRLAAELADEQIDVVLDLVGNSTILDSLDMLRRGGTACLAGGLGGLDPIAEFNPLLRMSSGVNLSFFGSFVFGTPGWPSNRRGCSGSTRSARPIA
ncbi:zinc-binding dehydrogenase [Mycobacterium sp. 2YAF39]|uniref:zinc-binding dehydrogenase n=1 Tax=Mycobacterium sp. 2YAF39 TaxID=3233033 RepID=UPI003F94EAB3